MAEVGPPELDLLIRAYHEDDAGTVARILESQPELRARVNEKSGPFNSPAVMNVKSLDMLGVLLAAGADINAKSDWWAGGFGILHVAEPGLAMAAIDRGAVVDAHAAARLGLMPMLEEMLKADPSLVNSRGGDGQSPLHFACSVEIAELLLQHGADIDRKDIDHESTPAQWMVASRPDVARFLVSQGCQTDVLMLSALGDRDGVEVKLAQDPESVRTRVSDEYFPMVNTNAGGTIYQWELGWYVSAHQVAKNFGHQDIFDLLMHHSPPEVKLINACWIGDEDMVDSLLLASPQLARELPVAEQRQIAHAARNNDLNTVRLMLKAGLPVGTRSQHNATVLHWACWHGNAEMVQLLLPYGPDLEDRENDYQGTPLNWALHGSQHGWHVGSGNYAGTVERLLQAGATPPEMPSGSTEVRGVLSSFIRRPP